MAPSKSPRGRSASKSAKSDRSSSKSARKPSAYNKYVARHLPPYLKKHPNATPKTAMKAVAREWCSAAKSHCPERKARSKSASKAKKVGRPKSKSVARK